MPPHAAARRDETPELPPIGRSAVLTHHWLVRRRGGERVLEGLARLVPGAPLYTLIHDADSYGPFPHDKADGPRAVHASLLQHLPGARRRHQPLLPLMPIAARLMRLPPVDVVICSDAAIAKAMRADDRSRVVCYCHSPMRYVWEPEMSARYAEEAPRALRPLWPALCGYLRRCDAAAARRVDVFVANSRHVAERIRRCYGRESVVVHPWVDAPPAPHVGRREDYYLCVGHHVGYKRLDLGVAACERLGRRLVVIGDGPQARRLGRGRPPGSRVEFLGRQPDRVVAEHYRAARALLFPGEEDFGIVPLEAMAHGCPVVAYGVGGAVETVLDGRTGRLFSEPTVEGLAAAVLDVEHTEFDPGALHAHAREFSRERFMRAMQALLTAS